MFFLIPQITYGSGFCYRRSAPWTFCNKMRVVGKTQTPKRANKFNVKCVCMIWYIHIYQSAISVYYIYSSICSTQLTTESDVERWKLCGSLSTSPDPPDPKGSGSRPPPPPWRSQSENLNVETDLDRGLGYFPKAKRSAMSESQWSTSLRCLDFRADATDSPVRL